MIMDKITLMKYCSSCETTKHGLKDFNGHDTTNDGRQPICKKCTSISNRSSRQRQLKRRYEGGDKLISICICGDFFNTIANGGRAVKNKCRSCSKSDLANELVLRHPVVIGRFSSNQIQIQSFKRKGNGINNI